MATPIFRWRHLTLLILLLVILIVAPEVSLLRNGTVILNVIGVIVLLSGLYAVSERKSQFVVALVLSGLSIFGSWLVVAYPSHWVVIAAHICATALLGFFAITILIYVMRTGAVTGDRIFAAICAYLIIGYAWAFAYAILDECQPGAFSTAIEIARNDYVGRVIQMRYFSFVTLATVGYGDIVPKTSAARTMTILEAIFGQFYLVALIGRLVGLHIVHGTHQTGRS